MARVNLLPVRALARLEQARHELWVAGINNLLLVGFLCAAYQYAVRDIAALRAEEARARQELLALSSAVEATEKVKAKGQVLTTKLKAIDELQAQKVGPAPMLAAFSDIFNELPRLWLTRLNQQGDFVTLEGGAMSQSDISAFQLALGARTPKFRDVELALVNTSHGDAAEFLQWSITCKTPAPRLTEAEAKAGPGGQSAP